MCQYCTAVKLGLAAQPEIIPPVVDDAMIPPATVNDDIDRAIVTMALKRFALYYIDVAEHIVERESTDPAAQLIIMSNMTNVTERVVRLIESIDSSIVEPVCDTKNGEN